MKQNFCNHKPQKINEYEHALLLLLFFTSNVSPLKTKEIFYSEISREIIKISLQVCIYQFCFIIRIRSSIIQSLVY